MPNEPLQPQGVAVFSTETQGDLKAEQSSETKERIARDRQRHTEKRSSRIRNSPFPLIFQGKKLMFRENDKIGEKKEGQNRRSSKKVQGPKTPG